MSFENAFALIVGIGRYVNIRSLAKPANDAESTKETLIDDALCGYKSENVRFLVDRQATKKTITNGLSWLASKASPDSTAVFFFAGHGGQDPTSPLKGNYLLPYDCDPFDHGTLDIDKLASSSISSAEFTQAIQKIDSQRLVVIFDCCHSGGIGDTSRDIFTISSQVRAGLSEEYYEVLAQGKGRVILASCLAHERSWERGDMHNGIFTTHLLAALRGRAAVRGDGLIHILDVFHDLSLQVPPDAARCYDLTSKGPAQQHPFLKVAAQDNFPIALDRGGSRSTSVASSAVYPATVVISEIRSHIINTPIKGVEELMEYLARKPEWNAERDALGVRLSKLKEADEQKRLLGVISSDLEAERRLGIFFALSICREIEDKPKTAS